MDSTLTWTTQVRFRYTNGSESARALELRDGRVISPALPFARATYWSTGQELIVAVPLNEARNTVRLTSIGDNGPNIDSLRVIGPIAVGAPLSR